MSFVRPAGILLVMLMLTMGLVACGGEGNTEPSVEQSEPVEQTEEQSEEPEVREVHTVEMVADGQGFRYKPEELTIRHGDKVVWEMVSGAPHNVSFQKPFETDIPDGAKEVLQEKGVFHGSELNIPGQTYSIHFTDDYPTGRYEYICTPHSTSDMIGYLTIEPREE